MPSPAIRIAKGMVTEIESLGGKVSELTYKAMSTKIDSFIKASEDEYEVELVCLMIAQADAKKFTATRSLSYQSYDYHKTQLGQLYGNYKWVLWLARLEEGEIKTSVDYHLRNLHYATEIDDLDEIIKCTRYLEKLWKVYK